MVLSGVATAVPLLLFAGAANRVPLVGLGILQYVAPILQLACGVLLFHEPMPAARLAGFALVWVALVIFTVDGIRSARASGRISGRSGRRRDPRPPPPNRPPPCRRADACEGPVRGRRRRAASCRRCVPTPGGTSVPLGEVRDAGHR